MPSECVDCFACEHPRRRAEGLECSSPLLPSLLGALGIVGDAETMVEQLTDLAESLAHPRIKLGIVPLDAEYRAPVTNFVIYDRAQVLTETVSAELTITRPSEILLHEKTFAIFAEQAAYGDDALALITAVARRRQTDRLPQRPAVSTGQRGRSTRSGRHLVRSLGLSVRVGCRWGRIKTMSNEPSLTISAGMVEFTDSYGYTHTAQNIDLQPGDVVSAQMAGDGFYFVVERGDERKRHPLRLNGTWHYTDLRAIPAPANPFLPDAGESNP
ncbi:Scr1 family TA system antitoxin-like transcriptional regulator [Nocardia sp. NPDC059239]|uniref:Scr1 family TA system antitoxin-like transcriptional regulator n=1 Tax=Nocardia sp. NPDC059239 TaxID=3346785 RepID=UPI00367E2185